MVTTAFVGAGMAAAIATQALPSDLKESGGYDLADAQAAGAFDAERLAALDSQAASRSKERGTTEAASVDQAGVDLWLIPVSGKYYVSSTFGMRWDAPHKGVDLACAEGTRIIAPSEGTVVLSRWYSGYGYAVILDHGNGIRTLYGHNSKLVVTEGQQVKAGDVLSLAGNTGYSFGPHLHFEVHVNGTPIDPAPFLRERGVDLDKKAEVVRGGRI